MRNTALLGSLITKSNKTTWQVLELQVGVEKVSFEDSSLEYRVVSAGYMELAMG